MAVRISPRQIRVREESIRGRCIRISGRSIHARPIRGRTALRVEFENKFSKFILWSRE